MVNWEYYKDAYAADDEFHAALVRKFGKYLAGTRRYQQSTWSDDPAIMAAASRLRDINAKLFGER